MKQINIRTENGVTTIEEMPYKPIIGSLGIDEDGTLHIFLEGKWISTNKGA